MRSEQEIFDELASLCASPGYVHAIAFLCFRDTIVRYSDEMTAEDVQHLFSTTRLIRTEIATLLGLLIKANIDFAMPTAHALQSYLDQTEALLEEMHQAMAGAIFAGLDIKEILEKKVDFNPFNQGNALREPIFYGGESAYSFQYRDLSLKKYAADDEWLKKNRGFEIQTAHDVVVAVEKFIYGKLAESSRNLCNLPPDEWTLLPGFSFTLQDISESSGLTEATVEKVLLAFALPNEEHNQNFRSLHDFNASNATPLLRTRDGGFILLQQYSLVEALYDSPFYWMTSDRDYKNEAMGHRGKFTEEFSRERLELVFGRANTFANVSIYESAHNKAGEIDALVLFGDRAIVLQAKSKRLTLEARRGNDRVIKEDFQKSVQGSYDQANKCAKLLGNPQYKLVDAGAREIKILKPPKEIYIICVVSDNYPALNFQAQQLLKFECTGAILPPSITDIFMVDAMTEMLSSPLYVLSYLNRRAGYHDRLIARDELTILSYHLKKNLWLGQEYDMVMIDDSICADLDIAMAARRDNVPGKRIPDGILTRVAETALGRIVSQIATRNDPQTLDLGFTLLRLSEQAVLSVSKGMDLIAAKALTDQNRHDISVPLVEANSGLTIHYNDDPIIRALVRLQGHCALRKYKQRADKWFGICLSTKLIVRFGVNLDHPWEPNATLETAARELQKRGNVVRLGEPTKRSKSIGRNEPCPCGSGKKHKKCCLK